MMMPVLGLWQLKMSKFNESKLPHKLKLLNTTKLPPMPPRLAIHAHLRTRSLINNQSPTCNLRAAAVNRSCFRVSHKHFGS